MAAELVVAATNEKLKEMDWTKNIEICELVLQDPGQAKGIVKAIKKRMGSKNSNTLLWAINLLEMLMNNCGEHIHRQVIDSGLLPILVKIVKKKSDLPVREKIFLLLDATQTSLGGASGRFPQYYAAYFELVSAGVKFSQAPRVLPIHITTSKPKVDRNNISKGKPVSPKRANVVQQPISQIVQEMRIIEKAGAALEVLRDVLDAIDSQDPEAAKDEFTLDLVEQCSFQKQCVMHLILTSRDENVVSKAIKLNDQLQNMLARHDTLLSVRDTSNATRFTHEEGEEEEDEMLFRRIRKGKACMKPDGENHLQRPVCLSGLTQAEMLHRPLIRPLCLEPKESDTPMLPVIPPSPALLPVIPPSPALLPVIPPPPAKHIERERFFKKRMDGSALERNMSNHTIHSHNASSSFSDGSALERNMSNLTLHSRNASSSFSESVDSSD